MNPENGQSTTVLALLDEGSTTDLITEELVGILQLQQSFRDISITTIETTTTKKRGNVAFEIHSLDGSYCTDVKDAIVSTILLGPSDVHPSEHDLSPYPHLKDVTFGKAEWGIEILLCGAHIEAWGCGIVRQGRKGEPVARHGPLGWTIIGVLGKKIHDASAVSSITADNHALHKKIDQIFLNDFGDNDEAEAKYTAKEQHAIDQLAESIRLDVEKNKYVVGLPWIVDREHARSVTNSRDSRYMAYNRTTKLRRKLQKDPELKAKIFEKMQTLEDKGYAVDITDEDDGDDANAPTPRWWLPIHIAQKKGKLRPCHDARANVDGKCLNDLLLNKPNRTNSLFDILVNFRNNKIAITADIAAFFHNVLVDPLDADVFRYFWFEDESMKAIKRLRFLGHVFGSGASSLVTSYALAHHGRRMKNEYPMEIFDAIMNFFYVDDYTGGARTPEEAKRLVSMLIDAMKKGGFDLAKWKSNCPEIFEDLIKIDNDVKKLGADDGATEKVLGAGWDPSTDDFTFIFDDATFDRDVRTPRALVSVQASLYDPLGFLSPFILIGRKLLQLSMIGNFGWDSPLGEALRKDFAEWAKSIIELSQYKIPRWWNTEETVDVLDDELHIFSDASTEGYGAIAYRRVIGRNGKPHVAIIAAKSHVVPLDPQKSSHHNSVPRLELVAALKAIELRKSVEKALKRKFSKTTMWSDSTAVLKQIFGTDKKQPVFVNNRLSKILSASTVDEWEWVDGEKNPADYCSRGILPHEKEKWHIFHHGPRFLWGEGEFPTLPEGLVRYPSTKPQLFTSVHATTTTTEPAEESWLWDIATACGGWTKKIRRIASIRRCASIWKAKSTQKTEVSKFELTADDYDEAERVLLREIQTKAFPKERKAILERAISSHDSRKNIPMKASKLASLNPFVGADGLICVGSRIARARLAEETKFPAVLPRDDPNVKELISYTHQREAHAGPKHVLCQLRQRFWILQGLQASKMAVNNCVRCQKRFKRPETQLMAPLPVARVNVDAPFSQVGLDMMGPFKVKMGNSRASHKVNVAIFSCLETRSVHAEIVYKMDASSLINALSRFVARRPGLKRIISDQGTNFKGADNLLKRETEELTREMGPELAARGWTWDWIPAGTPHYGGIWERVVGLFKRHMASLSIDDTTHVEVFWTIITEIEAIVNRRPLTSISTDPRDVEAISPAHILYPASIAHSTARFLPLSSTNDAEKMRYAWKRVQARVNAFQKVWKSEYLTMLHNRPKWQKTMRNLAIDDLVIIVDESIHRDDWKLGRIDSVTITDGHVRRVAVRRADGKIVERDRNKIVRLELDDSADDARATNIALLTSLTL